MAKYFRRYKKRTLRTKKRVKKGSKLIRSRPFKVAVKRIIHRMAENKQVTQDASNESITPADGTNTPYFINLLPTVTQGTTQANRIGNTIRIVKNTIKGYLNLRPYNSTSNPLSSPIIVKMFLVSWKYANSQFTTPSASDFSTFFQRGSATTNFIGNPLDMVRDINTDVWTVHRTKSFELASGPAFQAALNYSPVSYQNPSGVWSHRYSFSVGKYVKQIKYNDGIAPQLAANKNLYLVIQTVKADGTAVSLLAGDSYVENHWQNTMVFEDL